MESLKERHRYHTSVLHDKINFDLSGIKFKYQDETIFLPSTIQVICMEKKLKLENQ